MIVVGSVEEEKGVDCIPQFKAMQECFIKFPEEYGRFNDDDEASSEQTTPPPSSSDGNESAASKLETNNIPEPKSDSRSKLENVEGNSGAILTVAN